MPVPPVQPREEPPAYLLATTPKATSRVARSSEIAPRTAEGFEIASRIAVREIRVVWSGAEY